jgi:hypothetical protein
MNVSMQTITEPLVVISLITIGVLIFTMVLKALKNTAFFGNGTVIVVAICVTILCTIGIYEFFIGQGRAPKYESISSDRNEGFGYKLFLLPYTALAVTILLALLLLSVGKIVLHRKQKNLRKVDERRVRQVKADVQKERERRFKNNYSKNPK